MKTILIMIGILCLNACQQAVIDGRPNEQSPYFQVPVGSRLILHKPLELQAGHNRVYFQAGKSMTWRAVNIHMPHCALTVDPPEPGHSTITPDIFRVTRSHTERFFKPILAPDRYPPLHPAPFSPESIVLSAYEPGGRMEYEVMASYMVLQSEQQPGVTSMICADWGLPQDTLHITVAKIRMALGDHFSVVLAPAGY